MRIQKCIECREDKIPYELKRDGLCIDCHNAAKEQSAVLDRLYGKAGAEHKERSVAAPTRQRMVLVTTPTVPGREIAEPLGIVSTQVAFGMNVFRDIATAWRDTFGGRSNKLQETIGQTRKEALAELAEEAVRLGADAVVGVDIDMSEFSAGNGMVMMIATGTAVRLMPIALREAAE